MVQAQAGSVRMDGQSWGVPRVAALRLGGNSWLWLLGGWFFWAVFAAF